ncbi:threonine-phosphate decarboxylase CobD [Halomonas korlensis]|uniref:threonine-phosphate decarboxylase n=1 Tax=Halomonas korlensis TaxID=463301 RepID=A0A1I7JNE8_9GAMM|nr:threonine-phosphate decarboxylase CobD [Halomonas korlensis]SFU86676.1 L-threonine O-3-phosphate decarboxylase [Halomonas korlensis]
MSRSEAHRSDAPLPGAAWPEHGGQVAPLLARFGLPADHAVTDFSANLNPLGPPAWLGRWLAAACEGLGRYPDPDYGDARRAIAEHEGVTPEQVLLTNGGVEAIFLAAARHAGGRAAIVEPTFTEYARACRHYRLAIEEVALSGECFELDEAAARVAMSRCNVLFLCRPNNPTGTLVPFERVEAMLAAAQRHGCHLVVDEAFVDFVMGDERLTSLLARYPNLLLLRSLTKHYAVPGLRLGYLLGDAASVSRLASLQMPWSVNHFAAELVAPLLADDDYRARTRDWLGVEQPRLQAGLAAAGLKVVPSRANFFLLQPAAGPSTTDALFEAWLQAGILTRHTRNFPGLDGGWLRLALRSRADNDRLLAVLGARGPT